MPLGIGFLVMAASSQVEPKVVNTPELVASDMALPHEAAPNGVPETYDWAKRPRVGMGNNPGEWTAFIPWGQLYEAQGGSPAKNTKVEIRSVKAWILSKKTGQWTVVSDGKSGIEGAAYKEDFAGDVNKPAEATATGDGVIVGAGGGFNFHFWPKSGRVPIVPTDIAAVVTTCQARLVTVDPAKEDDRDQARFVLSMGGDYWKDMTSQWNKLTTNGDAGIGRFKLVRKAWQWFNMSTASRTQLLRFPLRLND